MSKLEKGLKEWISLGFISQEQAKRISDHEAAKPERSWILSGLLILGAVIVGIGVISLIAANWDQIPDTLKLGGDFVLLVTLALVALHSWENKKAIQFEVLLLFFLILCLASIGLISQIYHTGGKLYQALMLWSLITFATALAARQMFVPFVWAGAFLTGIVFTALDSVALQSIFHKSYQAVFMAVPLLSAGFTVVSRSLAGETGSTRAFRSWTVILFRLPSTYSIKTSFLSFATSMATNTRSCDLFFGSVMAVASFRLGCEQTTFYYEAQL